MGVFPGEGEVGPHGAEWTNLRTSAGAELLGLAVSAASLPVALATDHTIISTQIKNGTNTLVIDTDGSAQVLLRGSNSNTVEPNENGSIPVTTVITPPPASDPIIEDNFQNTSNTTGIDTEYTITSGKTLKITNFDAGAEFNSAGSIVEVFEDPNGDKSVLNRISEIFLNASSYEKTIDQDFVGDGTRRIVLRLRAYGGGAREISGRWRGYEE